MTTNSAILTTKTIDALTAGPSGRREIADGHIAGLVLRVSTTKKVWALRYRTRGGQPRRLQLGAYPALTLKDARALAQTKIGEVAKGSDPVSVEQAARDAADASGQHTFGHLAETYIDKHAKKHKRSWEADQRYLDVEILKHWRHRPVAEITRRDVRELLDDVVRRGSPYSANRILALVRKIFNFALQEDWELPKGNPVTQMRKPGVETSRDRVLSDDELRLVWTACADERPEMCALQRLRVLTAQRGGELAQLRWRDIKSDWLTIPETVAKNKKAHRVPLASLAKEIVDAIPRLSDEFIFPGRNGKQPCGDHKKAAQRVRARVLKMLQAAQPDVETFDFRGHDLRRTASTMVAEAGVPESDISKVLNHVDGGKTARATHIYNRYGYDKEKRAALTTLDAVVRRVLADEPGGEIVAFTRTAS